MSSDISGSANSANQVWNVLLYTTREREIDDYERLVRAANLPIDLRVCRTPAEADQQIVDADIVFGVHLPPEVYTRATRLKWIQSMWAGVEGLLRSPVPPNVVITKPWGVFGQYISQYVFAYFLAARVKIEAVAAAQKQHRWQPHQIQPIRGTRIGIAGLGDIGHHIARVAKSFDMEVWGLNRQARSELPTDVDRMFTVDQICEFVAGCDLVVIVLPSTAQTRGLFNQTVIESMREQAILINVGRGAVIDDEALIAALTAHKIAGAVLDVFVTEPLPAEHPYWDLPNCIITPHIGGPSLPQDITRCFLENFARFAKGQPLLAQIERTRGY